jgi:2-polyprenyl-6-methoxyphenol hydroxylase-like FAD-dependent oxidoreductase
MAVDVNQAARDEATHAAAHDITSVIRTTCCIVGAGPAGVMLALLLARKGIPVLLLETHADFEREFRGDTVHPSTMEVLAELGLAERFLELPHRKIRQAQLTADPPLTISFDGLPTRYSFVAMMPQARFLEFITTEAARYPAYRLMMGATVRETIEEDGVVRGVRLQAQDGWHEVRALLTVAADGRFSRLRHLSGLPAITSSPPMDVLWFRLPRQTGDPDGAVANMRNGHLLVMFDRGDLWQVAYLLPKGGYRDLHAAGLASLRQNLVDLMPWLGGRIEADLTDWKQTFLLSVESDRLVRWYRPGLLLIGDAAHTMSPVGGVGINYAIQDAVATANLLSDGLLAGRMSLHQLAAVQRRRELPTRVIQAVQTQIQNRVLAPVLQSGRGGPPDLLPLLGRIPFLRRIPPRIMGMGIRTEHVRQ